MRVKVFLHVIIFLHCYAYALVVSSFSPPPPSSSLYSTGNKDINSKGDIMINKYLYWRSSSTMPQALTTPMHNKQNTKATIIIMITMQYQENWIYITGRAAHLLLHGHTKWKLHGFSGLKKMAPEEMVKFDLDGTHRLVCQHWI